MSEHVTVQCTKCLRSWRTWLARVYHCADCDAFDVVEVVAPEEMTFSDYMVSASIAEEEGQDYE